MILLTAVVVTNDCESVIVPMDVIGLGDGVTVEVTGVKSFCMCWQKYY